MRRQIDLTILMLSYSHSMSVGVDEVCSDMTSCHGVHGMRWSLPRFARFDTHFVLMGGGYSRLLGWMCELVSASQASTRSLARTHRQVPALQNPHNPACPPIDWANLAKKRAARQSMRRSRAIPGRQLPEEDIGHPCRCISCTRKASGECSKISKETRPEDATCAAQDG